MIYAKKGKLINDGKARYFQLTDGEMITKDEGEVTNLEFEKIDFDLAKYDTKTTIFPKIQESSSYDLFNCIYSNLKKDMNLFKAKFLRCDKSSIKNIKQEFYKRFFKPIYLPLLALVSSLLVFTSKEKINYNKFKFYLFGIIFCIIVISEISLKYSTQGMLGQLFFFLFPILSFFSIYFSLRREFINQT
jgi:lipopolysaccharide export system permease protein